jgi:hypothetical protein
LRLSVDLDEAALAKWEYSDTAINYRAWLLPASTATKSTVVIDVFEDDGIFLTEEEGGSYTRFFRQKGGPEKFAVAGERCLHEFGEWQSGLRMRVCKKCGFI